MRLDINKYQMYFFDFDGVIVDSLNIKTEAFGDLFREYGPDIVRKVTEYHLNNGGVSRYEKFKYYYEVLLKKPITPEMMKTLDKEFAQKVKEKVIGAPMIPGVEEFLSRLQKKNKDLFVVSGTPEEEVRDIVVQRGLSSFFKEVVGSPKTKDENLKVLMAKYQVMNSKAVFFGDAMSDYKAELQQGIDFVAVMGAHNQGIFKAMGDNKINNFMNLI
jgi:phosphoglycolate phosphatase-like HAD superfamily hydrolase